MSIRRRPVKRLTEPLPWLSLASFLSSSNNQTRCPRCSVVRSRLARVGRSPAHVGDEEDDSEGDAEGSNDDVADGEEVVGAAEHIGRREHEVLASVERTHVVFVRDLKFICAGWHVLLDLAVQLAEVRQASGSHPHDEVL